MLKLFLIIFFLIPIYYIIPNSLIDTSEYFPLQNGNYWEYLSQDLSGPQYTFYTVTGDTMMSNGKQYKILKISSLGSSIDGYEYFRNDGNLQYKYFGDSSICADKEFIIYNFVSPDSAIWPICFSSMGSDHLTCLETFDEYLQIFNQNTQTKSFVYVAFTLNDTIWGFGFTGITHVSKNIGVTYWGTEGSIYLSGAILNGVKYGEIVGIKNKPEMNVSIQYKLTQNYPNPFNPTTQISFSIPKATFTQLKVYDVFGREIKTLVNEFLQPGDHRYNFNGNHLASGVYFYTLKTDNYSSTKKMVLSK